MNSKTITNIVNTICIIILLGSVGAILCAASLDIDADTELMYFFVGGWGIFFAVFGLILVNVLYPHDMRQIVRYHRGWCARFPNDADNGHPDYDKAVRYLKAHGKI